MLPDVQTQTRCVKQTHKKGGKPSFLSKLYTSSASKEDNCDFCGYVAENVRALTAHHRGCAQKKQRGIELATNGNTNVNNAIQYNPNL